MVPTAAVEMRSVIRHLLSRAFGAVEWKRAAAAGDALTTWPRAADIHERNKACMHLLPTSKI